MAKGRCLPVFLVFSLLVNAFAVPARHRPRRDSIDNEIADKDKSVTSHHRNSASTDHTQSHLATTEKFDDDDDFADDPPPAPSGGSNLASLLRLAGALLPSLSAGISDKYNPGPLIKKVVRAITRYNRTRNTNIIRRKDVRDNEIELDYTADLKPPPFQRQESAEESDHESSESDEDDDDDDSNNGAEVESTEKENGDKGNSNSKQDSDSDGNGDDYDSDEPPEGDGQGGGILGLLAGLSGGEDGQSDLGSLLAAVSGIVANLSGDGFDLNALIASGLGLFAGLLSEGEENPGAVIASYLLTSLDTITGGGAQNNGAFFGNLLSKLVKGTSAAGDPDASSEEDGNKMPMADSASFFASLLMSLLGEMSKTSSGGSSQPW